MHKWIIHKSVVKRVKYIWFSSRIRVYFFFIVVVVIVLHFNVIHIIMNCNRSNWKVSVSLDNIIVVIAVDYILETILDRQSFKEQRWGRHWGQRPQRIIRIIRQDRIPYKVYETTCVLPWIHRADLMSSISDRFEQVLEFFKSAIRCQDVYDAHVINLFGIAIVVPGSPEPAIFPVKSI